MYNLFITSNDDAWGGEPYILDVSRFGEYTDVDIINNYKNLSPENIRFLCRIPCVFAYESFCKKDPKFGLIKNIIKRAEKIKIEYEIFDVADFLTHSSFEELSFGLDISKWEINRTHWAIKDANLSKELHEKGITLPLWANSMKKIVDVTSHSFDVALSFPGEIREQVECIAEELERIIGPNSYFYDNNYIAQLARPELDVLLQEIYSERSKLIVVFLCSKYQEKEWCGVEFKAIREIIKKRQNNKVMFIRIDDGKVDGVFETDGYIDGNKYSSADIAHFIEERVILLNK